MNMDYILNIGGGSFPDISGNSCGWTWWWTSSQKYDLFGVEGFLTGRAIAGYLKNRLDFQPENTPRKERETHLQSAKFWVQNVGFQ